MAALFLALLLGVGIGAILGSSALSATKPDHAARYIGKCIHPPGAIFGNPRNLSPRAARMLLIRRWLNEPRLRW